MTGFNPTERQSLAQTILGGTATWLMLFGGGRCVAGDTIIDGHTKTIMELAEIGEPIQVITTRGQQWAEAPFKKGSCALLEFTLVSGRKIKVTPDHRFWDGLKWVYANDVKEGSLIAVIDKSEARLKIKSIWQKIANIIDKAAYKAAVIIGFSYDKALSDGYTLDVVAKSEEIEQQDYYTLHVPVTEQYFANGILHHNSGKTFLLVRNIITRAIKARGSRHLITRSRFNHLKASVMLDTFPKVMRTCFPQLVRGKDWDMNMTDGYAKLPGGSEVWFLGLDDKERMEKILGLEFATIYINEASQVAWGGVQILLTRLAQRVTQSINGVEVLLKLRFLFDCNPPNKMHWTFKVFKQKIDPDTKEPLRNPENYDSFQMNPSDNAQNLSPEYLETLQGLSARMQRRFLHGEFADSTPNALFDEVVIDKWRVTDGQHPDMVRVIVAVDPSGAGDDEANTDNDEIGITVEGLGTDGNAYLLEDLTVKAGPATWGKIAVDAYIRHGADAIIGESNFGGGMVKFVVQAAAGKANARVNFRMVTASRGKAQRAEPFSILYEQGKVRHVGLFPRLEDELCAFSTVGYTGSKSPNRADSHIWALAELFPSLVKQEKTEKDATEYQGYQGAGSWMS